MVNRLRHLLNGQKLSFLSVLSSFLLAWGWLSTGALQAWQGAALTVSSDVPVSDLRSCEASFFRMLDFYHSLGDSFTSAETLYRFGRAQGRFNPNKPLPPYAASLKLGGGFQVFRVVLIKDLGQTRQFVFEVQRKRDAYGADYYPFIVQESLSKSLGIEGELGDFPSSESCQAVPGLEASWTRENLHSWGFADFFRSSGQDFVQLVAGGVQSEEPFVANVNRPVEVCEWLMSMGQPIVVPAKRLSGSFAYRFYQQGSLPFGLSRLAMYQQGVPLKPVTVAYLSYGGQSFALLSSFEDGYQISNVPRRNEKLLYIQASVIFWLERVDAIPEGLARRPVEIDTERDLSACQR